MDAQAAIQQAQNHLKNAMELAKMPVAKEDLLYMWDNQITALDDFLAETEVIKDKLLDRARGSIRTVKKQLTDAVIAFEAKMAGEEVDMEEPTDEEQVEGFMEMAQDMLGLAQEALDEQVSNVQDLVKWEDPLSVINGYLADSEPFQEASRELAKARSMVRVARRDLKNRIQDVFEEWRMHQDEDDGDD